MTVLIDRAALEACLAHLIAEARQRREGVGLLSGRLDAPVRAGDGVLSNVTVEHWTALVNVAEFPQYRYEVDDEVLVAVYNLLEGMDLRPYVQVHSHLRGGGAPSDNDIKMAGNPALLHMIVDLEGARPVPYLWRIDPSGKHMQRAEKIRFQVADLRLQVFPSTDLTRGVSQG